MVKLLYPAIIDGILREVGEWVQSDTDPSLEQRLIAAGNACPVDGGEELGEDEEPEGEQSPAEHQSPEQLPLQEPVTEGAPPFAQEQLPKQEEGAQQAFTFGRGLPEKEKK